MDLKEFVKKVITDLDRAVSEANNETQREIRFRGVKAQRTALEFDVAVTVESTDSREGGGEIRVLGIGQVGGTSVAEFKNSIVSRVSFGVDIDTHTRHERAEQDIAASLQFRTTRQNPSI